MTKSETFVMGFTKGFVVEEILIAGKTNTYVYSVLVLLI